MDFEKFSERSRGFIQAAQTIALRENHQRVVPDHLLKALLDDDQGLAANLIKSAGGDPAVALGAVDRALAKEPKVEGGADATSTARPPRCSPRRRSSPSRRATLRHRRAAPDRARRVKSSANDALKAAGVTAQGLNAAINDIRKGRTADTASGRAGL